MLDVKFGSDVIARISSVARSIKPSEVGLLNETLSRLRSTIPAGIVSGVVLRDTESSGKGFFADRMSHKGECIVIDHPLASILDLSFGSKSYSGLDGADTIALLEEIVDNFSPELERCLRSLYPLREPCIEDDSLYIVVPEYIVEKVRSRLPGDIQLNRLIRTIQLNSMGFYTLPELCSYDDHLRFLTGTALYPYGSFFNHSCSPNVTHMAFGDVTVFRANRDISAGEELCISYIGSDLLCESKSVRDEFLGSRDFTCSCPKCKTHEAEDPWVEELDLNTRISIRMARSPEARASLIRNLLSSTNFIQRDSIYLKFIVARELGEDAKSEWHDLLEHARRSNDLLSVVIMVHYIVRFPGNSEIYKMVISMAQEILGQDLGSSENLCSLLTNTDFPPSSPFHARCIQAFASSSFT